MLPIQITRLFLPVCMATMLTSCNREDALWLDTGQTIALDHSEWSAAPIGIAATESNIWISDGDNNRMLRLDSEGGTPTIFWDFERPMHIEAAKGKVYIPEYGADRISILEGNSRDSLDLPVVLDAPAGITVDAPEIAIADFYNHKIHHFDGINWTVLGDKGEGDGQFHYPTDVQFFEDKIFVADAYNHRFQVFSKTHEHLATVGETDSLNAATGIFVNDSEIFLTDFENDRVLVYNHDYSLKQVIAEGLDKPTDMIEHNNSLYIINYKGKNIRILNK